ncbi:sugar ABC transporter [Xaviernesmea oryzae]|uniref:Sugar ABC transporter n=1 Tax=Xaviernesmea oryzae TaxID=464029 RepID=A0A1Q9B0U4_9HYPH|nr:sugar ABC transporter permease [Xaviernesmea oryzae]OLP61623.1 sugar ABC transporter [Xaviernesmea oryzae]SEL05905.1 multiple sugar transport system permease protein [Xaviernesmea oryzae]
MRTRFSDRRKYFLFLMAAPAVLYVAAVGLWPLAQGIGYSFYKYNLLRPARTQFVGFQNYVDIFTDPATRRAILNTFQFTLFSVALQLVLGFCLAMLLWRDSRFNRIVLAFLLIPATITPLVVGLIFKAMLGADYGIIGFFLAEAGIGPRTGLLTDANTALWVLILIDCWEWTPLMTLILLAGLKALPADVLEAGRVDGATGWQRFHMLILPLMLPSVFLALTLRTMDAFRVFDSVFVTTGGGPNDSTNTLMMLGVKEGLQFFNVGFASAVGNVTLLFIALIATVLLLVVRRADVRINGK